MMLKENGVGGLCKSYEQKQCIKLKNGNSIYFCGSDKVDSIDGFNCDVFWLNGLAAFRQDPRFTDLMTELGLVDYWREHGWPDTCQPAGDSLICE